MRQPPLPLGSIICVSGSDKLLMVISRGIAAEDDDGALKLFEYGTCLFPEGLVGDLVAYTNDDCISEVLFRGYETEESIALPKAMMAVMCKMQEGGMSIAKPRQENAPSSEADVW